jgi:hypothetical protein
MAQYKKKNPQAQAEAIELKLRFNSNYQADEAKRRAFVNQEVKAFCTNNSAPDLKELEKKCPNPLPTVDLTNKAIQQIGIHPVILSLICGTFLGDSSLTVTKGYKNARMQFRHSTRQSEWFMWKAVHLLKDFSNEKSISFTKPDGYQKNAVVAEGETLGKLNFMSQANEKLTALWSIICPGNVKTVCRHWLNHMNAYFLMTLWLDDGSLSKNRQGIISCNKFQEKDVRILADYITTVWGVKCNAVLVPSKATKTNPNPMQIEIADFENLEKFIRIIAPLVPVKSMLYKVLLYKPNNPAFLQRWISELKGLVRPEWHSFIEERYVYLEASASTVRKSEARS